MIRLQFLFITLFFCQHLIATTHTVCASGCDFVTITDAIAAASSGDIIDIQDPIHTEENINVSKNLTIQGQGQTTTTVQANGVQADAVDGVFKILTVGLTVAFQNMTIQNGNALGSVSSTLDNGGGVYIRCNASTNVTFDQVTIKDNKSVGDRGGGVYITDDGTGEGTIIFTNCVISGNEATSSSGDGGGIANLGADNLTLSKCTLSGNIAGDDGGAFYVFEEGSVNKFINCTIFNNAAGGASSDEGRGGALFLSSAATFSFFNCTMVSNSLNTVATRQGGCIYHTSASTLDLVNTIVANNSGATSGNDVYTSDGSSTFTQTTSLVEDCEEGGGTCPQFSYFGDPNLAAVATCGVHSYFATASRSFISDNGTAPGGDIPSDDICGTARSIAKYDIGSYDDVTASSGLVETKGDIEAYFCTLIDYLPLEGLNDFVEPTAGNLTTWDAILDDLLADNTTDAETSAATIDYQVVLFTDNTLMPNKLFYLLQKLSTGTNYWGTYVFNSSPCREIIIEAPHPIHDTNTGKQGIYCLKNTDSRALLLSGTHRCNNTTDSTCDGMTTACSVMDNPFKISDLAHNSNNCFQATSDKLHDEIATSVLIQLHGFTPEHSDPDVILSNGTTFSPSGTDYANDFKTHLAATDGTLTFKVAHKDTWTYLIGTTNTQGRYINGENAPCSNAATAATGRFIHFEQEKTKLRDNATGWAKVATALGNLISCVALPVELINFNASLNNENVLLTWKTASEQNNRGFYIERGQLLKSSSTNNQITWKSLGFVESDGFSFETKTYAFTDESPLAGINYYRLKQVDFDDSFEYSNIRVVDILSSTAEFSVFPNPSTGRLHFSESLSGNFMVINVLGQVVWQISDEDVQSLDLSNLAAGTYLLQQWDQHDNLRVVRFVISKN
ncbi:MAG: T9SS type A sorting domain-containing protein [Bacteroidetes bacterium]|nr:T9SS type A sorting domain-containing protein [Bacteroidota bacterium]